MNVRAREATEKEVLRALFQQQGAGRSLQPISLAFTEEKRIICLNRLKDMVTLVYTVTMKTCLSSNSRN